MPYKDQIKLKEYKREWYEKNKENIKDKRKEYMREDRKTPQGKKYNTIYNWKSRGLIGDYEAIYDRYINTNNCDLCNVELSNKKYMDHDHITGEFRNIVCNSCNTNKSDNKKPSSNTTGYKNIHYCTTNKVWVYQKTFKGKYIHIRRKNKIDILCIKFAAIILYRL
jgi:hypothetical protein